MASLIRSARRSAHLSQAELAQRAGTSQPALARYETAWASILVASLLGLAFYGTIAIAERFVLSWHPSSRRAGE